VVQRLTLLRIGTVLSGGVFAFLWSIHDSIGNRQLGYIIAGISGVFAALAIHGFILIGRESAQKK